MDELKNFHKKEKEQLDINFQKVKNSVNKIPYHFRNRKLDKSSFLPEKTLSHSAIV